MEVEKKDLAERLAAAKAKVARLERQERDEKARHQKRIKELIGRIVLAIGVDLKGLVVKGKPFVDWVVSDADKRILSRHLGTEVSPVAAKTVTTGS